MLLEPIYISKYQTSLIINIYNFYPFSQNEEKGTLLRTLFVKRVRCCDPLNQDEKAEPEI